MGGRARWVRRRGRAPRRSRGLRGTGLRRTPPSRRSPGSRGRHAVEPGKRAERRERARRSARDALRRFARQRTWHGLGNPRRHPVAKGSRRRPRRRADRGRRASRRRARPRRRGEELERVVVGVATACVAHSEVEVGTRRRGVTRGAHGADPLARRHVISRSHGYRRQVEIARVVAPVARSDANRPAGAADRASEAHHAGGGRYDRSADRPRDVDASVLTGRVGVAAVAVGIDDLAPEGPDPARSGAVCRLRAGEQERDRERRCGGKSGHAGDGRAPGQARGLFLHPCACWSQYRHGSSRSCCGVEVSPR